MSPEIFKGVLTEKSDIWSSAVIMIVLLTGINPFIGNCNQATINNIKTKELNFS